MNKVILTLTALMITAVSFGQAYTTVEHFVEKQNPVGLAAESEDVGTTAGWTNIYSSATATPMWTGNQSIPFPFNFDGSPVTQFKVSNTGVLTFDVGTALPAPSATNAAIPDASIPDQSIMIWGMIGSGSNDRIRTKTYGTTPNRQHWIQFASFSVPGAAEFAYWSIVIEETTDRIYIVDQRQGGSNLTATVGVQVDGSTAFMAASSPNTPGSAPNATTPYDNNFWRFEPASGPSVDVMLVAEAIQMIDEFGQGPWPVLARVINYGTTTINTLTMDYKINGTSNAAPATGLSIAPGGMQDIQHPTQWNPAAAGSFDYEFSTGAVNGSVDPYTYNNATFTRPLVRHNNNSVTKRHVLIEEFTTAPCGYCPDGALVLEDILDNNPDVIAAGIHAGFGTDAMTLPAHSTYASAYAPGAPSAMIDRNLYSGEARVGVYRNTWTSRAVAALSAWSPADISLTHTWDAGTREIDMTVDVDFKDFPFGGTEANRINIYIIEDNLVGSGTGWDQRNYYSSQEANPAGGSGHAFYNEPSWIPGYVHRHVCRAIPTGTWGDNSAITKARPEAGDSYTANYSYTLPAGWDEDEVSIIAFVGYVFEDNLNYSPVWNSTENKLTIESAVAEMATGSFELYPNPATTASTVVLSVIEEGDAVIELNDISGKTLEVLHNGHLTAGSHTMNVNVSDLAAGMYVVTMTAGNERVSRTLIVD